MSVRLVELYEDGGLSEVQRGINDWYLYNVKRPVVTQVKDESRLEVGDVSIQWTIANHESASRAVGISETAVMEDFVERVDSDDVFWDVGANQGIYSMLAAEIGAEVQAFEPGDHARSVLYENAAANDVDMDVHPVALSEENGQKRLAKTGTTGTRRIVADGGDEDDVDGDIVPIKRGDEVSVPGPDVMKIDVEGHELSVLEGLGDRLDACRLCYVEVHDEDDERTVEDTLTEAGLTDIDRLPDPKTILRAQ